MVAAITNLRNFVASLKSPENLKSAIENTKNKLCANNEGELFLTAFCGVLNLTTEKFIYVNAGHNRNRTVWAELLARYVVSKKLALPFEKISVGRDDNGKPYIVGKFFEISLSHCGDWVACSVGNVPNGVDIEKDSSAAIEIAQNFFTADEYKNLCALSGAERNFGTQFFIKRWNSCGHLRFIEIILQKRCRRACTPARNIKLKRFHLYCSRFCCL